MVTPSSDNPPTSRARRSFLVRSAAGMALITSGASVVPAFSQSPGNAGLNEIIAVRPPQPVPNDGRIEVLEFFAYGCGACAALEPLLEQWEKKLPADVNFKRVPTPITIRGINSIPIFYGLQALGQLERLHAKVFIAANRDGIALAIPATLNKWLEDNGVSAAKYEEALRSFSVQTNMNRASRLTESYAIQGTPTIAVAGRVTTAASGDLNRMMNTVTIIIDRMRDEMRDSRAKK